MQNTRKSLTYLSLFSSAGIGCYGFKKNNFECIATVEIIKKRINIQKYNNKCKYDSGYIEADISELSTKNRIYNEIDLWKSRENLKEVDVIIATPPCQGMSVANHKKNNEIHRNSLVLESINLINKIQPRFFIFENVKAFLSTLCNNEDGKEITINQAIDLNLLGRYNILKKVINFKDYGSHSSRTRTLVVGVRKDIKDISPYDLFPTKENPKTLKEVIGKYPPLIEMGSVLDSDIYHNFKEYDARMLPWVENTKEGFSAFDNQNVLHKPHKIVDSKIVLNQNKNGDKYKRCSWNIVAPCIHTRNDILSSQSTIHPIDNRVFSIRELMDLMTIPEDFQWTDKSFEQLNILSIKDKKKFLKKEEINIRQSIGEAVPTRIFEKIAYNIQKSENAK